MLDTQQNVRENIDTAANRVEVDHGIWSVSYDSLSLSLVNVGSCGRLRKMAEAGTVELLYHIQFY